MASPERGGNEKSRIASSFLSALIALTPLESMAGRDMRLEPEAQSEIVPKGDGMAEMKVFHRQQVRNFWLHLRSFPTNMQLTERLQKISIQEQRALQNSLEVFAGNIIQENESAVEALQDFARLREFVMPYVQMRGIDERELQAIEDVLNFISRLAGQWLQQQRKKDSGAQDQEE